MGGRPCASCRPSQPRLIYLAIGSNGNTPFSSMVGPAGWISGVHSNMSQTLPLEAQRLAKLWALQTVDWVCPRATKVPPVNFPLMAELMQFARRAKACLSNRSIQRLSRQPMVCFNCSCILTIQTVEQLVASCSKHQRKIYGRHPSDESNNLISKSPGSVAKSWAQGSHSKQASILKVA